MTLVEVLIATAIVGGVALFLAAAIRIGFQSWQVRENMMSVSFELRRGINEMSRELAECQATSLQLTNGQPFPADGVWYNGLGFQVPEDLDGDGTVLDAQGSPEWGPQIQYARGGLGGTQLVRTQGGQVRVMANGVTNLQFRRQAAAPLILEIFLSVQRGGTLGQFVQQANLTTRVRLRN